MPWPYGGIGGMAVISGAGGWNRFEKALYMLGGVGFTFTAGGAGVKAFSICCGGGELSCWKWVSSQPRKSLEASDTGAGRGREPWWPGGTATTGGAPTTLPAGAAWCVITGTAGDPSNLVRVRVGVGAGAGAQAAVSHAVAHGVPAA